MRVAVFGLWHLGCVTAACLAEAGHQVVGLDDDQGRIEALQRGVPPVAEPGLAELLQAGLAAGRLSFTARPAEALATVELLWVTFDTPVDDRDEADVTLVRERLDAVASAVRPGTLVLVSSQVPVGFTAALARDWNGRGLRYAYVPENLRVGRALESFRRAEHVVVGIRDDADRPLVERLFQPFCRRIEWMEIESAEMTKHALNAFLATSVAYINEVARVCEATGADARQVERGIRGDPRVGPHAYVSPGGAFAGGTLARDVRFLQALGRCHGIQTPAVDGVLASNADHAEWVYRRVQPLLAGLPAPVAAVLGLTYKPGTNTLRRSAALEMCVRLRADGVRVQAHDPAVSELPVSHRDAAVLCRTPQDALRGSDLVVIATPWPEYRALAADDVVELMRRPRVVDQHWLLAESLGRDRRITYIAVGRGRPPAGPVGPPGCDR